MTPDQITKANAELQDKSAFVRVSSCDGARASARFHVHCGMAQGISGPLSNRMLKRRERRAPLARGSGRPVSQVSLTPGFSRVVGAANEGNGFNRFPRANVKPLKRLSHRSHLVTGLKPGVNEMAQ